MGKRKWNHRNRWLLDRSKSVDRREESRKTNKKTIERVKTGKKERIITKKSRKADNRKRIKERERRMRGNREEEIWKENGGGIGS